MKNHASGKRFVGSIGMLLLLLVVVTFQAGSAAPAVEPMQADGDAIQLATSSGLPGVMMASFYGSDIPLYSIHGGQCWHQVATAPWEELEGTIGTAVAVVPRDNPKVPVRLVVAFSKSQPPAAAVRGVYRTGDYGRPWAYESFDNPPECAILPDPMYFRDLVVSAADPSRLYLTGKCEFCDPVGGGCTFRSVLYTSSDAGMSWTNTNGPDPDPFTAVVPSPIVAGRVYVLEYTEFYADWFQSDDGGQTWTEKDFPMDTLVLDAQDPDRLYGFSLAPDHMNIWRSEDGGDTWSAWWNSDTCTDSDPAQFVAHPTVSNVLFVRCDNGLFRSQDGGDNWQQLSATPGQLLAPEYGNSGRVLWAKDDGLWASSDQGETWQQLVSDWSVDTCPSVFLPTLLKTR